MRNVYTAFIYLLVIICGGCAVTEVVIGEGSALALICVIAGLSLILYIMKLPVGD